MMALKPITIICFMGNLVSELVNLIINQLIKTLAPNGSRYRRLEGRDSPAKRTKPKATKKPKNGENPAVRVHALLARILPLKDLMICVRHYAML
jgi:hypothetical protein